jgi:hypothetical protein
MRCLSKRICPDPLADDNLPGVRPHLFEILKFIGTGPHMFSQETPRGAAYLNSQEKEGNMSLSTKAMLACLLGSLAMSGSEFAPGARRPVSGTQRHQGRYSIKHQAVQYERHPGAITSALSVSWGHPTA